MKHRRTGVRTTTETAQVRTNPGRHASDRCRRAVSDLSIEAARPCQVSIDLYFPATSAPAAPRPCHSPAAVSSTSAANCGGGATRPPPAQNRLRLHAPAVASTGPHRRRRCGISDQKPSIAASASRRKLILQPGICSASTSEISTCTGPPGALAMQSATWPSPGGAKFGPARHRHNRNS